MCRRIMLVLLTGSLVLLAAGLSRMSGSAAADGGVWKEVTPGVFRSACIPCAYALLSEGKALLIDAPEGADLEQLCRSQSVQIEKVLLTHHHRDTVGQAGRLLASGVKVCAPKPAAPWLLPEEVAKYWKESVPLRTSRTAYFVIPAGLAQMDCSLEDGSEINWRGWKLKAVSTPGHSPDHLAFLATNSRNSSSQRILFAGDALSSAGKMWSPFTTDWDHWTDLGQKPAADSLERLVKIEPTLICPAHGVPIREACGEALAQTMTNIREAGFLKSFERFSKERLGNAPQYAFLAQVQAGSAGDKPWSQLTPNLFYTGNTYVLVASDRSVMVFDPWGKRSVDQVHKLRNERGLGPVELVMFSHAHYDHYDGVYDLAERGTFEVWALDEVAIPIAEPYRLRAPFLDARPIRFDRRFRDGASATWKDYTFTFHHFPGQTYYTMAVETTIDGKRCVFTGDNFFHVDLYSGTGGWMGLNRSWPSLYRQSAEKLLRLRPQWVLAEHGGAFEFHEDDVQRRVSWAAAAAWAADRLAPSGRSELDWNPHRIHVEPLLVELKAGDSASFRVRTDGSVGPFALRVGAMPSELEACIRVHTPMAGGDTILIQVAGSTPPGRHIIPFRSITPDNVEVGADSFIVLDVKE